MTLITVVEVAGHAGKPVAAPCCLEGCQYSVQEAHIEDSEQRLENAKANEARIREHYLTQTEQLRAYVEHLADDTRYGISARHLLNRLDKAA